MFRFIAIGTVLIALAIAAPKFAPGLLATALRGDVVEEPAAPPAPRVTTAAEQQARIRPTGGRRTTIPADRDGHYYVNATVNGRSVEAVVDTGATTVALTAETARRLGIVPPQSAYTAPISTANGITRAAPVMLNEIRLGGISVRNVEALVNPGDALAINLLGMTFLNRLTKFESAGGQLVLVEWP